jgi:hypothetical protein
LLAFLPPVKNFAQHNSLLGQNEWRVVCNQGEVELLPSNRKLKGLPGSVQAMAPPLFDWLADTTVWPQTQTIGPAYAINGQGPSPGIPGYLNQPRGRAPHYVAFTGSFQLGRNASSMGGGIIVDRYGNFYKTLGSSYGWGLLPISLEVTYGMLPLRDIPSAILSTASIPSEADLQSFLTGGGLTGQLGPVTAAGSISCSGGTCMLEGAGGLTSVIEYSPINFNWYSDKDESFSWDWVDRTPGFTFSDIQFNDPPHNECMDECGQVGNIRYAPLGSSN